MASGLSAPSPPRAPSLSSRTPSTTAPPPPTAPAPAPSLARRLLFPHLAPTAPLPSITSDAALDAELHDFAALALRAFVHPWWARLSRYDRAFLPQIAGILAHVLRELSARARAADWDMLVFVTVPTLLQTHVEDARRARARAGSSYAAGGGAGARAVFRAAQAHRGVAPDGGLEPAYVRAALDGALKALLPQEDWDAETERTLVREIVGMVVGRSVAPKLTQPWFIHKVALDALGRGEGEAKGKGVEGKDVEKGKGAGGAQALLVLVLSAVNALSRAGLALVAAYHAAAHAIALVNASPYGRRPKPPPPTPAAAVAVDVEPHIRTASVRSLASSTRSGAQSSFVAPASPPPPEAEPDVAGEDLALPGLTLLSTLFSLGTRFSANAAHSLLLMLAVAFGPFLDRALPYALHTRALTPSALTAAVGIGKRALFPDGYPAAAPPDPTPEEQVAMRALLVRRIVARVPPPLATILLGPPEQRARTAGEVLAPFDDAVCNMHLFVLLLDAVLLALFPEMGVGGDSAPGEADEGAAPVLP